MFYQCILKEHCSKWGLEDNDTQRDVSRKIKLRERRCMCISLELERLWDGENKIQGVPKWSIVKKKWQNSRHLAIGTETVKGCDHNALYKTFPVELDPDQAPVRPEPLLSQCDPKAVWPESCVKITLYNGQSDPESHLKIQLLIPSGSAWPRNWSGPLMGSGVRGYLWPK